MRVYRFAPLLAFLAPTIALGACVEFEDPYQDMIRNKDGGSDAPGATGTVARFKVGTAAVPDFLDVPFPSDVYVANGRFVDLPALNHTIRQASNMLSGALQRTNGASRIAPSLFLIDDLAAEQNVDTGELGGGKLDRASLPADEDACVADSSSVFLVDLDATDPTKARIACRASVTDESAAASKRFYLGVGPARGIVLEEGHRYATVVTSRVRDAGGKALLSSEDFKLARSGQGPVGAVYKPAYDKVVAALGGALASDSAEIVAIAPFTTQKLTQELYAVREALEPAPAATLHWDEATVAPMFPARFSAGATAPAGFTATLDDWLGVATEKLPDGSDDPNESLPVRAHDKISAVGTAVFDAVNYLQVRKGYDDIDHATFLYDGQGVPTPPPEKPTSKIWITISVPKAPMPEAGYPVVIVQHGLNGSRHYLLALANQFAAKGWMAVAIDSVTFGARSPLPEFQVDKTSDHARTTQGAVYKGPDGISDSNDKGERSGSEALFGNLLNFLSVRDQLRQAAIDTVQVVKLLGSNPDLSPLTIDAVTPKIDATRIAYIGDSLGGIEGATAAALEPKVKAWTLNVAGAGVFTELAGHGPAINGSLYLAASVNFGINSPAFTDTHPITMIGQTIAEAGDPIAYARRLITDPAPLAGAPTAPRNIFQTSVVYDEVVPNEANEALARAAGYGIAAPNVGSNAGVCDAKTAAPYPGGGMKSTLLPDAPTGYHDTPKTGVTAVLAQISPGQHGVILTSGSCSRGFQIPLNKPDGSVSFVQAVRVNYACPYRELQNTMLGFFGDAFEGKVPTIAGLPVPVRDADGDGIPDASDPNPMGK